SARRQDAYLSHWQRSDHLAPAGKLLPGVDRQATHEPDARRRRRKVQRSQLWDDFSIELGRPGTSRDAREDHQANEPGQGIDAGWRRGSPGDLESRRVGAPGSNAARYLGRDNRSRTRSEAEPVTG